MNTYLKALFLVIAALLVSCNEQNTQTPTLRINDDNTLTYINGNQELLVYSVLGCGEKVGNGYQADAEAWTPLIYDGNLADLNIIGPASKVTMLRSALSQHTRNKAEVREKLTEQQQRYEGKIQLLLGEVPLVVFAEKPNAKFFVPAVYNLKHDLLSPASHQGHICC